VDIYDPNKGVGCHAVRTRLVRGDLGLGVHREDEMNLLDSLEHAGRIPSYDLMARFDC